MTDTSVPVAPRTLIATLDEIRVKPLAEITTEEAAAAARRLLARRVETVVDVARFASSL